MLTVVLLVLLAGGTGLLAVSLTGRDDPATPSDHRSESPSLGADGAPPTGTADDEGPWLDRVDAERTSPGPTTSGARTLATVGAEVVVAPRSVPTPGDGRRRGTRRAPAARTAIEGEWRHVAQASVLRRTGSALALVGILLALAALVAVVLAAAVAAVGGLLGGAVG